MQMEEYMESELLGIFRVKLVAINILCLGPQGSNAEVSLQCDVSF